MSGIDAHWIDAASCSDVGRVRSANQDRFAEFEDGRGNRLLVVADGMGGHRGGETASRLAVEAIGDVFENSVETLEAMMSTAVAVANQRIHAQANADPELAGMGTTVVALCLAQDGEAWVAHVGDSRLYVLRDGELDALTGDHSVVAELERQGFLNAEEAHRHPRRNELTRSVGVAESVEIEVSNVSVKPGDRFLLCSDGLCGYVDDEEIGEIIARGEPRDAARALVELANAKGGYDNVTVQVVAIRDRLHAAGEAGGETPAFALAEEQPERASDDRPRRIGPFALAAIVVLAAGAASVLWLLARS